MVSVTVRRLPKSSGNVKGLHPDIIAIPAANALAETIANELEARVKDLQCEDHPNSNSVVIIEAVKGGKPRIDKNGLCCKKLSDRIQVTIR